MARHQVLLSADPAMRIVRPSWQQDGCAGVKIINTDGLAFIGPGSEWFWTAVSGIVLAVTFIAIWRQLALQRSAAGYAQVTDLSRQDVAEPMLRVKVEIYQALRNGCKPTEVPFGAASYMIDFWEDVAVLVRQGHINRRLLHETMGNGCRRWWGTLHPFVERVRAETGPRARSTSSGWRARWRIWIGRWGTRQFTMRSTSHERSKITSGIRATGFARPKSCGDLCSDLRARRSTTHSRRPRLTRSPSRMG